MLWYRSPYMPALALQVLLVEDDPDVAEVFAMLLHRLGHTCRTAGSGSAALTAATAVWPDLVLIDLGLPDMNGNELAHRLRAERAGESPYLVALTGHSAPDDKARSLAAGFDEYAVKPIDVATLAEIVARAKR